jgi:hypothetical protein
MNYRHLTCIGTAGKGGGNLNWPLLVLGVILNSSLLTLTGLAGLVLPRFIPTLLH